MSRNKPITGDLMPDRNGVHNLGGPNNYFNKAYIRELVGGAVSAGGGGGANKPYSTYVIAPSDCESPDAANADVVLTGTNDNIAINTVVSSASHAKLLFLDGTIDAAGPITLKSTLTYEGMGNSTIFKVPNGSSSAYDIFRDSGYVENVTIRNFKVDGNSANVTNSDTDAFVFFNGANNILIENITVQDLGKPFDTPNFVKMAAAFETNSVENITIRNNTIINGYGSDVITMFGDYSTESIYNVLVDGNVFKNCDYNQALTIEGTTVGAERIIFSNNIIEHTNDMGGAYLADCSHCIVANNDVTIGWDNLVWFSPLNIPCTHNVVYGNTIKDVTVTDGIYLDWGEGCFYNIIDGNTIHGNGGTGITIGQQNAGVYEYNIVSNNILIGHDSSISDQGGNTIIEGNICIPNTSDTSSNRNEAIICWGPASVIRNNTCVGRRTEIRAVDGSSTDGRSIVSGNKFINCINHALEIQGENCKISDNYFYNNNSSGTAGTAHLLLRHVTTRITSNSFASRNMFRNGTNTCAYCVKIETSSCSNNLIADNDMRGGYSTSAFLDNGTGTITTPNWT